MNLTKKRVVVITIILTLIYFVLFLFLPDSIVGSRANNILLFAPKVLFLSITTAVFTSVIILLFVKKKYLQRQWFTFNRYKHLLRLLVRRDFVSRYRKSILGVLWSMLNPLLTMLVMTFVFSYLFRRQIDNFPVYLISGQFIFGFYNESTTHAMSSIISSEGIMHKVYVPKYVFPLARVLSSLVNLLFSFFAFLLVFLVTGARFHWTMFLLPIPIIYTFLFSLGISMLMSSLVVFFRDLQYLYGIFTLLLMYLTPIFYPIDIIPEKFIAIMGFNPLYHFVDYFRDLALRGTVPDMWSNIVCMGFSLAALCFGIYIFMSQQEKYIMYL